MPIPTYDALMLPVLRECADKSWVMKDLVARIGEKLKLSPEELEQRVPSGGSTIIASRVHWAKTFLKQAGLLEQPKHGVVQISERGPTILGKNPSKIDVELLKQFPEFQEFLRKRDPDSHQPKGTKSTEKVGVEPSSTPDEQITSALKTIDASLRDKVLTRVLDQKSPAFFERLILDLLRKIGYGGSIDGAGEHIGKPGDEGLDGLIREDELGLDRVYLQAKHYKRDNAVGIEAVHAFKGALLGAGASKGVLITTSSFSKAAQEAAKKPGGPRIVLINGDELTDLMVRFEVGVRVAETVKIKAIDPAYFGEQEAE